MLRELAYALAGLLTGFFGVIAIRGVPDEWEKASISPSFWQDKESLVSCSLRGLPTVRGIGWRKLQAGTSKHLEDKGIGNSQ